MSLSQLSKSQNLTGLRQNHLTGAAQDLENAIARFQAILTDQDRVRLQKLKGAQHDTQSIITFTAELDGYDPKRRGKSIASRLATLLQVIQQFIPVVDTFIQSNPDLAALIWGAMRVTFLLLANFTSYFESFVELLTGFGALSSRFSEYQFIFTQSTSLRDSIFRFHTSMVLCCERIVTIVRRPFKKQALKALTQSFQSEIRTYVDDIKSKAETVAQEIQLAKAQSDYNEQQLQSKEREEATSSRKQVWTLLSKSRSEMRQIQEQEKKRTEEERRRRLLKNLSTSNHNAAFNNARNKRHLGTAEWIFAMDEFKEWHGSDESSVLHVTGKIGSGKTVLASRAVEYLCQKRGGNAFISYFFSRFDDIASLNCDTIIRSLVHQVLCSVPMDAIGLLLASEIMNYLEELKSEHSDLEALEQLYLRSSTLFKNWFIVLDGADECHPTDQDKLYQFLSGCLEKTSQSHNIKIWISGRETTKVAIDRSFLSMSRIIAGSSHTSSDIKVYAEEVLQYKVSSMQLVVRDKKIIDEIIQTIVDKEQGMFLWVFFTIEELCSCKSDKDIRQALLDMPSDLPAVFNRALGRIIQQRHQKIAKDVFLLAAGARRPLTLAEVGEALSIEAGQRTLKSDDLINGIERLTVWCENLIHIEETDNTVHFGHQSILEFLLMPEPGLFGEFHFDLKEAHQRLGEICVTYLNLDFKTALMEKDDESDLGVPLQIPVGGIAAQTIRTAVKGRIGTRISQWTNRIKSTESTSFGQYSVPIHAPLASPGGSIVSKGGYLWDYAANHWYFHDTNVNGNMESEVWSLLDQTLRDPQPGVVTPWTDFKRQASFVPELHFDGPLWESWKELGLRHRNRDKSLITNLAFAIAFACDENHTLACRALLSLVLETKGTTPPILTTMTIFLAVVGNHLSCPNKCVLTVFKSLDNKLQMDVLMRCIALGITSWPAGLLPTPRIDLLPKSSGIQEEVLMLIENGYQLPNPLVRATMILLLCPSTSFDLDSLCAVTETTPEILCQAKTPSGKSILEIAIETRQPEDTSAIPDDQFYSTPEYPPLITSFFRSSNMFTPLNIYDRSQPFIELTEEKRLATNAFYTALRYGKPEAVEELAGLCSSAGCPYPHDTDTYCRVLDQAFQFLWSFNTLTKVVETFCDQITASRDKNEFHRRLFKLALKHENWYSAGVLHILTVQGDSKAAFYGSACFDQIMHFMMQTYACTSCMKVTVSGSRKRLEIDTCPIKYMLFNYCSSHGAQVRKVLLAPERHVPSTILFRMQYEDSQQNLEDCLRRSIQNYTF